MSDAEVKALQLLVRQQRDALVALTATVVKLERAAEDAGRRIEALEGTVSTSAPTKKGA